MYAIRSYYAIMYKVHICPLVTISQGEIAYVFARDGEPLPGTQTLGKIVHCNNYQGVKAFLVNGGQRGIQRSILREGTYAFNLAQFVILTKEKVYSLPLGRVENQTINKMSDIIHERNGFTPIVIKGVDDSLGIVTVHDGPSMAQNNIVAPTVGDRNNFV